MPTSDGMQMLYNSDSFAVVHFEVPAEPAPAAEAGRPLLSRGGYEIVDKASRREIFIEGALAERFQQGVQALVQTGQADAEQFDAFIAGFAGLAQQPFVLH